MCGEKNEKEDPKSIRDLDRRRLIQSGKQLLSTIYEDKKELERGKSFLLKEKKPERGFRLSLRRMEEEGKGYVLSSINPVDVKRKYDVRGDSISYHWLTVVDGESNFDPSNLHIIGHDMINFLEDGGGLIFMEGVEIILNHNSFDRFWGFLNHLVDVVSEEESILVLSLDPSTLSEQSLAQIERKLELIH
ncbi:MAG: DUF835 domain-containing protein [Candidatus Natronoplasma sp.]